MICNAETAENSATVTQATRNHFSDNTGRAVANLLTAVATEDLVGGDGVRQIVLVGGAMFAFLAKLFLVARSRLRSRASLEVENLVLRQQVIVLSRKSRSRVRLRGLDRPIFVWLYRCFPAILNAITVVKPETVILRHRRGLRAYWRWKSRRPGGRPNIDREIRPLIRRMSKETHCGERRGSTANC